MPVGEVDGTLRIELNHSDPGVLSIGFRADDNDGRILTVALNLRAEGHDVVLVTKDLPMRVKAAALGLAADEYRAELAIDSGCTGMAEISLTDAEMAILYGDGQLDLPVASELPCHTGLVLLSGGGSALGRVASDKSVRLVRGDREAFGCTGARPSSASPWTSCWTPRSGSSLSSVACSSRCSPGLARDLGWCSPMTWRGGTTCGSAGTTGWPRSSRH